MNNIKGKFILLTPEYPPDRGGIAEYLYSIVKNFNGEVQVIRGPFFWKNFWPHWLRGVFTAWRAVKNHQPNMIWISHVLPMGYIALLMRIFTRTPYAVFTHGMDVSISQELRWKHWWAGYILRQANFVVANSQFTSRIVQSYGVLPDKIYVLYPSGQLFENVEKESKSSGSALIKKLQDKKIILSVGRLIPRKGQLRALKALTPLLKNNPEIHYVIIGDGQDAEIIEQYIKEEKLKSSVTLAREVSNKEMLEWYSRATIFLLPTVSNPPDVEGFGLVFIEAGRNGIPVIGGKGGGVNEAITDGVNGFLINGNSQEEIHNSVQRLLSDGVLRRRFGEQGKKRAEEKFNTLQLITNFKQYINESISLPPAGASPETVMRQGLVSVIIPTYNHKKELLRTLKTITNQTYNSLEIIVVDDGSTDDTKQALQDETARWSGRRSFTYLNIEHSGAPKARNFGIQHARGTLVIFWDADIIAEPEMIEKMVMALRNNTEAAFVYSSFYFGWKKFACEAFNPERLKKINYITTASLIRREYFPGFDESLARFQDWDLYLTISERGGKGVWIDEALFRITPRARGLAISTWLPSFIYKISWLKNWQPVKSYLNAKAIVLTKHKLV